MAYCLENIYRVPVRDPFVNIQRKWVVGRKNISRLGHAGQSQAHRHDCGDSYEGAYKNSRTYGAERETLAATKQVTQDCGKSIQIHRLSYSQRRIRRVRFNFERVRVAPPSPQFVPLSVIVRTTTMPPSSSRVRECAIADSIATRGTDRILLRCSGNSPSSPREAEFATIS